MKKAEMKKSRDGQRRVRFERAAWRWIGHAAVLCTIASCWAPLMTRR